MSATMRLVTWCLIGFASLSSRPVEAQIRSDEKVVFFPTAAALSEDERHWEVPIHGWIFEPEVGDVLRDAAVDSLRKTLGLKTGAEGTELFTSRCRLFLVDNERGKYLRIRVGEKLYDLDSSNPNGHFTGTIQVDLPTATRHASMGWLEFQAETPAGDSRRFSGTTQLIPLEGMSVISDIDDTIKISVVTDHRELMKNTFLRNYEPVEGMADVYRRWHERGATFHFVSSSPWQLYEPLQQFAEQSRFPSATFHLKQFRLKDSSWRELFADPLTTKPVIIESLLQKYPQRRFVLVGDSGEQDPEVYGLIARKYPVQIIRICIRDVTNEKPESERYQKAFQDLRRDRWQIFTEPRDLADVIP